MKTSIKALIAMIGIVQPCIGLKAQNTDGTTGIYLTETDYKANKLSYVLSINDRIELHEFLDGKNVSLTYQGKKVKLAKSEIYGYHENNQDFRFYHNEIYRIADTAGFTLYTRQILVQQGKGYTAANQNFYSVDISQPILELTIANLSNSFPADTGFRYSLRNYFVSDGDLMEYDEQTNRYKIKYLYFQQKQVIASHGVK